ncbi:MAG: response regulator transcription factor [Chloroflexota bacterium]
MIQPKVIGVLIVDDHTLVRRGLSAIIETTLDIAVVGEAADGMEAVAKAAQLQPDVILMDIVMPRKNGIEATLDIKQANPDTNILVLTSFDQADQVFPAIKAGAIGYLLKDATPDELLRAIRDVSQGKPSLHPNVALRLIHELKKPVDLSPVVEPLTERELEVLNLLAEGFTNRAICTKISISERTVGTHVSNILSKLHLANRTQAALYAQGKSKGASRAES